MFARALPLSLLVACNIEDAAIAGKPCPCPAPYVCIEDRCEAGCTASLIANPDFEDGTGGWRAREPMVMLTTVEGGFTGRRAARLCTATAATFTLDDEPDSIFEPVNGASYRLEAWLRGSAGGERAELRVGQFASNGSVLGSATIALAELTIDWQRAFAIHSIVDSQPGSTLDLRIRGIDALAGTCLEVDCVRLVPLP